MNLHTVLSKLANHIKRYSYWYFLFVATHLMIWLYFWFEWHTFIGFVEAIDRNSQFMQDFVNYYYPMSKQILQITTPISGYFYTSFFAILLVPISILPLTSAMFIWGVIQLACLVALFTIWADSILKLPPNKTLLFIGLFTTSYPILNNIKWGQVSTLLTVCIIGALLSYNKNKRVLAGILLAFATAIKFYPIFFLGYFILKRDIRTCVAFGISAIFFYAIFPATILGFSNWFEFEKAATISINTTGWILRDANSQYIVHVLLRWFTSIFQWTDNDFLRQELTVIGYIIVLLCIWMTWRLQKNFLYEKYALSIIPIFLAIPFVIKTSWPHYFVYLPLCQVAVLFYYASFFRILPLLGKGLIMLPVISIVLSSAFFFNVFDNWSIYNANGFLFISNLLLLVALYFITIIRPSDSQTL